MKGENEENGFCNVFVPFTCHLKPYIIRYISVPQHYLYPQLIIIIITTIICNHNYVFIYYLCNLTSCNLLFLWVPCHIHVFVHNITNIGNLSLLWLSFPPPPSAVGPGSDGQRFY